MAEVEIWKKFGNIEVSNMGNLKTKNHPDGDYCGSNAHGYKLVSIKGKKYLVHRLVGHLFLGLKLDDTKQEIDHINGIKNDNRIENLRIVSTRENQQNAESHRNGRLVGASFHKAAGKWRARIRIDGEQKFLGYFDTELEAHLCYMEALEEMKGEV